MTLNVRIWRGAASSEKNPAPERWDEFEVPRQPSQTVLDVVTHVQRHLDTSVSYRFACRVGMCGSCAMMVNGKPRWTCRTHVDKVVPDGGSLTVAPLANLPVVKDLAVDMSAFFDRWTRARGRFVPGDTIPDEFATVDPSAKARQTVDAGIECIGCGVCYAACDVVRWDDEYLGPAALNRAWCAHNDEREDAGDEREDAGDEREDAGDERENAGDKRESAGALRLASIAASGGCLSCHTQGSCTAHCPKQLDPSAGIAGLKRAVTHAALRGKF